MREFSVLSIILFYIFTILTDCYILRDILSYCRYRKKAAVWSYSVSSVLFWGLVTVIAFWPAARESSSLIPLMWMIYTYFSVYVAKLLYVVFSAVGRLFRSKRKGRRVNYGVYAGIPLSLVAFIFMWWGALFTRNEIVVENVTVVSGRLPQKFNGYRIVQFSDAHVGTWGNDTSFVSRLVDRINSLDPDLIVFTGDVVNRETSEMEPFLSVLSRLKARDGVYSVLGNHDYGDYMDWSFPSERDSNNALMRMWQRQIGWRMLNNGHTFISRQGDSIALIGVENWGEPPFRQYGRLAEAYSGNSESASNLRDGRFKILLSHNPEHWNREVSKTTDIDLTLSGHTHAMQMVFKIFGYEWSPSKWRYPQWKGMYERVSEKGDTSAALCEYRLRRGRYSGSVRYCLSGNYGNNIKKQKMISGTVQSSIVTLSFGSNHGDRMRNVAAAIGWFQTVATGCRVSSIYETPDVTGHGAPYMNAVASGCTELDYCALNRLAKDFEVEYGRDADCRKRGVVPIDIDIVIWKSETLRPLDFSREFFQIGYREILPAT